MIPASAGVNRPEVKNKATRKDDPRECGGEPYAGKFYLQGAR